MLCSVSYDLSTRKDALFFGPLFATKARNIDLDLYRNVEYMPCPCPCNQSAALSMSFEFSWLA